MIKEQPHLRDYLQVIKRRYWIIITFFIAVVFTVLFGSLKQRPVYRATCTLMIEWRSPNVISFQEVAPMGPRNYYATKDYYETQYKIITSRSVLKKVADDLEIKTDESSGDRPLSGFQSTVVKIGDFLGLRTELFNFRRKKRGPLEKLIKSIEVIPVKNSQLVDINAYSTNPHRAAAIANTLAVEYVQQNLERNITMAGDAAKWLTEKIEERKDALRKSELALQKFREAHNRELIPMEAGKEALEELKAEYAVLEAQYANFAKRYTLEHPKMIELKAQLAKLKNKIEVQEDADIGTVAVEYRVIEREVATNKQMYEVLLTRLKEINLTSTLGSNNVSIIDRAEVPDLPVKPNIKLNLFIAIFIGLAMGTGLAFFVDYLDTTVKTIQDVTEKLNAFYLGTVPAVDRKTRKELHRIVIAQPKSPVSEAIRAIRTEILLVMEKNPDMKTVLFTSSTPQAGKTTIASNIALSLAQKGNSVLFVDGDLRRPQVHRFFNLDKQAGLSEFLTSDMPLEKIIKHIGIEHIGIITSGKVPPNPAEIISSRKMLDFIELTRKMFDYIVFDAPPVSSITDSIILADKMDVSVQVVRSGKELVPVAVRATQQLAKGRAKFLGVIINGFKTQHGEYYDRDYQYYGKE